MILYLIRHGNADYSKIDKNENCSVVNLAPLSKEGIEQAIAIKPYIKQLDNPIICSSPYTRTLQTAYIASESNNIIVDYRLHEWLPDNSFHCKVEQIYERNQYFKTNTQNANYETKKEMATRFCSFVDDIITLQETEKKDASIVIFSHARAIASFLEKECNKEIYLKNCQFAEIIYENSTFTLNRIF